MTITLLALGISALVWPVARPGERRMRALIETARLVRPATSPRRRAGITVPAGRVGFVMGVGSGVVAAMWRGPVVGIAACAAAGLVSACMARAAARRAAVRHDRDLSGALRLLRAELDAGSSGQAALSAAAAVAGAHQPAFEACARAARDGDDLLVAVDGRPVQAELVTLAQAWQLADGLGVPLADVLGRVDEDVQARRSQARVVASALAGPRSSAALLAGLPVLGILLGTAMGARPLGVLFDAPSGRLLLCVGVLLDVAGVVWTDRLIRSAERS